MGVFTTRVMFSVRVIGEYPHANRRFSLFAQKRDKRILIDIYIKYPI